MSISPRPPYQTGIGLVLAVLAALAAAASIGLGLRALKSHFVAQGEQAERARWEARQVAAEREAHEAFAENVKLGRKAAALQLADERGARRHAERLATERRHATLTLAPLDCVAPLARSDLRAPDAPSAGLTADAVRLWNSALAGRDVPAGACGADAAPGGACAADSGITVADAWDNQAANALSCRVDRARLTRLIAYLQAAHDAKD